MDMSEGVAAAPVTLVSSSIKTGHFVDSALILVLQIFEIIGFESGFRLGHAR